MSTIPLGAYEKLRLENIKRNEEFLKSLGLDHTASKKPEHKARAQSTRKKPKNDENEGNWNESEVPVEPMRKSRRLSGEKPDVQVGDPIVSKAFATIEVDFEGDSEKVETYKHISYTEVDISGERQRITAKQIADVIQSTCPAHDELISNEILTHTAYRMSYMSIKQLVTRLNAITRSASKSSYEKLLVFYYALEASGLGELAGVARTTLQKIGVQFS